MSVNHGRLWVGPMLVPADEQAGQLAEQVERVPLVADRADRAARRGGRHDLGGVPGRPGDRFFQVDRQPLAKGGDGGLPVETGRGADEQRPELLAAEQVAPVRVGPRAGGEGASTVEIGIAHRHELGVCRGVEYPPVLPRDPARADDTHPDGVQRSAPGKR
jgi:hypothetical protein